MKISGLLIAAGFSSRMGKPKAALLYNDIPFAVHILLKLNAVCDDIVLVLGDTQAEIQDAIKTSLDNSQNILNYYPGSVKEESIIQLKKKLRIIINEDYANGMFTSLQRGMSECAGSDWVVYHFIDNPLLPFQFYSELIEQTDNDYDWIQPRYQNKNAHPVLLNKRLFNTIINAGINSNLKQTSAANNFSKKYWDCNYSEVLIDIDTPAEYNSIIIKK